MNKANVLIFPAGGENAINIYDSLKYNLHFELFGATSKKDYYVDLYKKENFYLGDLYINDSNFITNFNKILSKFKIKYVIPTHDVIALYLMENEKNIKAKIICSPLETTRIANSKKMIFQNIMGKFYCPKVYTEAKTVDNYPVFVKPNIGVGGKGATIINNVDQLKDVLKKDDMVICEYLPGNELTVDCFTDKNGKLLFIGPRTRERITIGISFDSKKVPLTDEIAKIANDLNETFKFRGAWFFQVKQDSNGNYKLMEFSVRMAGTMALYRELGINFALLSLFDAMNLDVKLLYSDLNIELNRRLQNSYQIEFDFDTVYIDFDDTIIINNRVNTIAMQFIYQCFNKNKNIILISKHSTDIYEDLKNFHIDKSLFNKIIHLNDDESKVNFINTPNSIFIDNYFKEREEVHRLKKIPVFDVDAIESLIDYSDF